MKRLRRVTEAEVIAEFLKNEFYGEAFHQDREQFERLVLGAQVSDEVGNALRRALLFRRHGHMWRELPGDTQWWQVQIEPCDLERVQVFPRAQWRRVAHDSLLLKDIVRRIKAGPFHGRTRDFVAKIQAFSYRLRDYEDNSAVLLIGIDDEKPLTVIEGNHRLTAALLASPKVLQERFRVFCGLSPHMAESCWYQTNLPNLWRYARNRARTLFYDRDADVERLMKPVAPADTRPPASLAPATASKVLTNSEVSRP
ncbi:MAG TPA: hypothetical protein VKV05_10070 [Terriglobales bacterium]|nr:hypothetical protein [Terriglobales bacterium]